MKLKGLFLVENQFSMSKNKRPGLKTKRASLESNRSSVEMTSEYELTSGELDSNKSAKELLLLRKNNGCTLPNDEDDSLTSILNCRKARRSLESIDFTEHNKEEEEERGRQREENMGGTHAQNPPRARLRRRNACEELDALV